MAGVAVIPWYATVFRHDAFADALAEIAPVAMRYGATSYAVYRARDDMYKFQQMAAFEDHLDWERYWEGPEMTDFRSRYSSWYQVPVLYGWWDLTLSGGLQREPASMKNGEVAGESAGLAGDTGAL